MLYNNTGHASVRSLEVSIAMSPICLGTSALLTETEMADVKSFAPYAVIMVVWA